MTAPVDVDALTSEWRVAIHAAQKALQSVSASRHALQYSPDDLRGFGTDLARERVATAKLIDAIAREEHLPHAERLDAPWAERALLGLPDDVDACIFDLDGVLTGSAHVHMLAWADTFDPLLARRAELAGERYGPYRPFTPHDYAEHIHGKPRVEGIHAFLASRGIRIRTGRPGDPSSLDTIEGLAKRKNEALLRHLEREGVAPFAGSILYLRLAAEAGLGRAVVTASTNAHAILARAGVAALVGPVIDGNRMRAEHLRRKPAPDMLEAACEALGVPPARAAAFETSPDGVAAAHAAGLRLTVGVQRPGRPDPPAGADVTVADLVELLAPALAPAG